MKPRAKLAYAALFLFLVLISGFGGCSIGSNIGHSMDVQNGTFGKGLEGSPNELGLLLLGWLLGMIAGIVIFVAIYRKRRAK